MNPTSATSAVWCAPRPRVPLLIIQGTRDAMMPDGLARAYYRRAGQPKRYVSIPGNHFILLDTWPRVRDELRRWLGDRRQSAAQHREGADR
ncbi:MAG: alpha/beta hydrolase [Myxococcales bacterium]|nr:alpha/beta hydrolase [Myxococcales bacterium]